MENQIQIERKLDARKRLLHRKKCQSSFRTYYWRYWKYKKLSK